MAAPVPVAGEKSRQGRQIVAQEEVWCASDRYAVQQGRLRIAQDSSPGPVMERLQPTHVLFRP